MNRLKVVHLCLEFGNVLSQVVLDIGSLGIQQQFLEFLNVLLKFFDSIAHMLTLAPENPEYYNEERLSFVSKYNSLNPVSSLSNTSNKSSKTITQNIYVS